MTCNSILCGFDLFDRFYNATGFPGYYLFIFCPQFLFNSIPELEREKRGLCSMKSILTTGTKKIKGVQRKERSYQRRSNHLQKYSRVSGPRGQCPVAEETGPLDELGYRQERKGGRSHSNLTSPLLK